MTGDDGRFGPSAPNLRGSLAVKPIGNRSHPIGIDVIDCIELPILVLNRECAVDGFNPAAAALLSLVPSDVGRPLRQIRMLADVKNLQEACEHVIQGGSSSHWEVGDDAGSWFSLRIGPCKANNQTISGVVLTLSNVTALRASLQQAIDEREHSKAIINTVADPLVVLDDDLRVQAANEAFYRMFQASREVTRAVRLHELGTADWDVPRLRKLLERTRSAKGEVEALEVDHAFPGGGQRTLLLNARRLSRGRALDQMTLVAIQDITDRKRAEETLAQNISEQRWRRMLTQGQKDAFEQAAAGAPINAVLEILARTAHQLVDATATAIFIVDAGSNLLRPGATAGIPESFMSAQDGFRVGPQFPSCSMAAQTGQTVIVPDIEHDPLWRPYLHLAREHGFRACWSFPIRSFGGKVLGTFALYHAAPSEPDLPDTEIIRVLAETTAILVVRHHEAEERQRAEEALRRAEEELRDFVENASVGLHWVGPDGAVLWANHTELEMLGYTKEEYIGHHIAEFHVDRPAIEDMLRRLKNRETLDDYEARLRCKDGSIREVVISSNVLWEGDEFIHTRCFTRDITDRKRAEEARARLVEELEETLRFNEIFAGILAHDLRSPLAGIVGAAQLLSLQARHGETASKPISRILSSGERMARLIEQLLDFTRARRGGGIPIEPKSLDLSGLAAQMVEELGSAASRQIVFTSTGDTRGQWDADRLAQVMTNLLANAIEYGEPAGPVRFRIDGSEPDAVRIEVSNRGAIAEGLLPTLFDPFRRAATGAKAHGSKGLGLGLYIVQLIVRAHGGDIGVQSSAEDGTRFLLRIPRIASRSALETAANERTTA